MTDRYGYPPLDQQCCGTCRYGIELPKRTWDDAIRCARHPPVVLPNHLDDNDPTTWGCWPAVFPDAWCGHWAPVEVRC
jgi:hypothetical protein